MSAAKVVINTTALQTGLGLLADALPAGLYAVTFVARYIGPDALDANIVMTNDDLPKAIEAIQAEDARKTPRPPSPKSWPRRCGNCSMSAWPFVTLRTVSAAIRIPS